jgi:hypothetical protein
MAGLGVAGHLVWPEVAGHHVWPFLLLFLDFFLFKKKCDGRYFGNKKAKLVKLSQFESFED